MKNRAYRIRIAIIGVLLGIGGCLSYFWCTLLITKVFSAVNLVPLIANIYFLVEGIKSND